MLRSGQTLLNAYETVHPARDGADAKSISSATTIPFHGNYFNKCCLKEKVCKKRDNYKRSNQKSNHVS